MTALSVLLLLAADEALDQAIRKTGELSRYTFSRRVERDGQGGTDAGAVDGPLLKLESQLGTLYRKGKAEVLLLPSGAIMKSEPLPEGPMRSPHEDFCELARNLKGVAWREEKGAKVGSGPLEEAVLRKHLILLGEFRRGRLELHIDGERRITKCVIEAVTRIGARELTQRSIQTLDALGTARIDVPAAVAKGLDP